MQRPPSTFRQLKSSHFHSISASQLIEEENLPFCKPEQFYPVRRYRPSIQLRISSFRQTWIRCISHGMVLSRSVVIVSVHPLRRKSITKLLRNRINSHLGKWRGAGGVGIPPRSLEESEENKEGRNKELFLQFIRSMLRWLPEERKPARDFLDDPWLKKRIE